MAKCDVILNPPLQNPGYASVNCSAERLHKLNKFLLSTVIHACPYYGRAVAFDDNGECLQIEITIF